MNNTKKIILIVFTTIAFIANTSVITQKVTGEKNSLNGFIQISHAQTEDPWNYPLYDEVCLPCTNEYGQSGIRLECDFAWSWCHRKSCGYGYC